MIHRFYGIEPHAGRNPCHTDAIALRGDDAGDMCAMSIIIGVIIRIIHGRETARNR
ncbi:hypothetical protein D3C77_622130 [compost metagenome]